MGLSLAQKVMRLHNALERAGVPHAFGGALALAYCTQDPRGTNDIDINLFVSPEQVNEVLAALPRGVRYGPHDVRLIERDGQARLWWGESPVDVFFSNHEFHERARARTRTVPFDGHQIPVLDCTDLAVFKAFFARSKDFVDIETMVAAGALDANDALRTVSELLGADHPNVRKLRRAIRPPD